jgi:hypothetical protein
MWDKILVIGRGTETKKIENLLLMNWNGFEEGRS